MIGIINDLDVYNHPTTIQLIEYKKTNNNKVIEVTKSFIFRPFFSDEIEFQKGSTIPKRFLKTTNPYEILSILFTKF